MSMPTVSPSTMNAIGTIGGSTLGGVMGYFDHRQQFKEQKELMDKSMQQSIALWLMQNAYMSPKNQMQRFAEAGLNPDLIYGKLGDTSASMPSVSTPQVPTGTGITQGALAGSQIRLQDSLAQKNISESKSTNAQTDFYLQSFDTRLNLLTGQLKLTGFQSEHVKNMADYIKQSFSLLNAQTEYWRNASYKEAYEGLVAEKEYQSYDLRLSAWIDETKSRYRLNNSTAYKIEKEARFLIESWADRLEHAKLLNKNLKSQTALNYGLNSLYNAEVEFTNQKMLYLPFQYIEELGRGGIVFEHDDEGNIVLDDKGKPQVNKTYSAVKLALEFSGEVFSQVGEVFGMVLPFKFLKSGFSVGGAKSATNSLQNGHMPSAKPSSTKQGFQPKQSDKYYETLSKYRNMPPGKEKDKLYWELTRLYK